MRNNFEIHVFFVSMSVHFGASLIMESLNETWKVLKFGAITNSAIILTTFWRECMNFQEKTIVYTALLTYSLTSN